jgi:hypothetical protein
VKGDSQPDFSNKIMMKSLKPELISVTSNKTKPEATKFSRVQDNKLD